ncbi:AraC family transcriptional regulator [Comamonas faecalis]|uniref:AraC family transcriptional regulator n=1 Tax=Comamonas faecalis TaxID=1387849 RepID=A0ABP7RG46_9BURK
MVTLVRAAALNHFAEVMSKLGGDPDQALRQVGLRLAQIQEQDQLIDAALVSRLLEDAARSTGCESFGLQMAQFRQPSNFGVLSLLLLHQPTLRHVLTTLIAHVHQLNEALVIHMEETGGVVILREDFVTPLHMRQPIELAIGVLFRMCEVLLGERWRPLSVCFSHSAPVDASVHRRLFRCRVEFDAEFNGIVCRAADLDEPNPLSDPVLVRYAKTVVDTAPMGREATIGQQARKAIYLMLPLGNATCASVAQALGRSVRTLQRELDGEGLSFTDLLGQVRYDLARRYVGNPRYSVGEIAVMLGYSSHSAFTRWFTARFGCAPEVWRSRLPGLVPPRAPQSASDAAEH